MIYDNFGRPIKNLRVSVTRRCNLNCFYCHREGDDSRNNIEMSKDEIARIVGVCAGSGIRKVKITGGEPLLREDIPEIIGGISNIDGIGDISLTTNATLDADWNKLRMQGLDRINISLDSLDPDTYSELTNSPAGIEKVISNIEKASRLFPLVKLNVLVLKGVNDLEIPDMIEFSSKYGIVLQLIELLKTNDDAIFSKYFYDLSGVEKGLNENADKVITRKMHNRKKYILGKKEVEVIRPTHNTEFCVNCNRMRITADGKFKPCLMRNDNLVDFLTPMRAGATDDELEKLFVDAVNRREPYFSF
ncbi:MAG: cyclic pyranopterin phosphate synthase [Candidatus Altiarchaeales archaeon WOR_SM1_86-2]|nr:MAG: cyclic pyranopterin phosphate synthase [Candidatus Altiarchaeales archaeon WOR_SM1_86-2]ODS41746.1 MAG: cyclic pyranopterin phosphate synthase [Candidatus Altiarchaeales archaeon WOR_SM1_79]